MGFLNTMKTKLLRFNKKVDDYQEAITFSSAGVHDHTMGEEALTCAEYKAQNLLVASYDNRFSEEMVTYALEMAKRMDYGILAVNAANLTHDMTEFFSTTHDKLYKEFKETSTRNVEAFRTKAVEQGLKFAHTVRFSNIDHAIDGITKECGEIEFIISENREQAKVRGVVENGKRMAQHLCVYSVN